jgi:MFS family permease
MNYSEKRTIILYSIPWIVFSLVNVTLAKNASTWISQQVPASFHLLLLGIQFVGVILGCFLGGIVADFFGRRVSLFLSLTSYGVSAALIGLFTSDSMLPAIYTINGLSWGILFTLYIFVIWSDLANEDNIGKMFSIGFATYYLSIGFGLLLPISIPIFASSLATCFLIFLCNLPIAIAPELLSPTFRDKIKIKLHIEAVKKIGKKQKTKPSRH